MAEEIIDVPEDEFPFYEQNPLPEPEKEDLKTSDIPQGPGSALDSDTVDGIQAVTSAHAGPNKLVATGSDGTLPSSVIPAPTTGYILVESKSLSAASTSTFSGLLPGVIYKLDVIFRKNSDGFVQLRINSDSAASYRWTSFLSTHAGASGSEANNSDTSWGTTGTSAGNRTGDTGEFFASYYISTNPAADHIGIMHGTFTHRTPSNVLESGFCGGYWDKSADTTALNSITILNSAGTVTGLAKLFKVI